MPNLPQPKLALLLDFDGTITMSDVGAFVIGEFAKDGWQEADDAYDRGEISLREVWAVEVALLRAEDHDTMRSRAVEFAEIRSGFSELIEFCRSAEIPVEVASSGVRFYIEAILEKAGVPDLVVTAPDVEYDERGHGLVTFRNGLMDCGMTAMCKCERVWRQRRLGREVVFVGDGASDQCAALQADHVMARDSLARYCKREGREFKPFDNFFEVQQFVKQLNGG